MGDWTQDILHQMENLQFLKYLLMRFLSIVINLEVNSKSLNENYSKLHKELAECKGKRYTYIEELDQHKLDINMYKNLVDGDLVNNEILFGTTEKIPIHFKMNVISNHDPNFKSDEGVLRRGILVNHTNKFYDDDEYEIFKNNKGVYLKNKWILEKYKKEEYKNALFHLLVP